MLIQRAQDKDFIKPRLYKCLTEKYADIKDIHIDNVRLVRHKPGRRFIMEYTLSVTDRHDDVRLLFIMGKSREKSLDRGTYYLNNSLFEQDFGDMKENYISVPEPIGVIPDVHMWLYRKVHGVSMGDVLAINQCDNALLIRIAMAAYMMHRLQMTSDKVHSINKELDILRKKLPYVVEVYPYLKSRINDLLDYSEYVSSQLSPIECRPIIRDFYPEQLLLSQQRLYLIDLDLFCLGDPAVDIGNFLAHMTEYSIRVFGQADALRYKEQIIEDAYLKLAGNHHKKNISIYKFLSLARLVAISCEIQERRMSTRRLLKYCEQVYQVKIGV